MKLDRIANLYDVFIFRGLPGSGKTTLCNYMTKGCPGEFIVLPGYSGIQYGYSQPLVPFDFQKALEHPEKPPIFVDGCNLRTHEVATYLSLAWVQHRKPVVVNIANNESPYEYFRRISPKGSVSARDFERMVQSLKFYDPPSGWPYLQCFTALKDDGTIDEGKTMFYRDTSHELNRL